MTDLPNTSRRLPLENSSGPLSASLSRWQLLAMGVGAIVGAGIFVVLGEAINEAGPSVLLSFVFAAVAAGLTAFAYAELASKIRGSGGAFTYTYTVMGERYAWVAGWMIILEVAVVVAAVSVGWSGYLNAFLGGFGIGLPAELSASPSEGGLLNLPAVIVVALAMLLLIRGASESARINAAMVVLKIGILVFFCVVTFTQIDVQNLTPFAPFGVAGIAAAASQVFFSYLGFDAVSTAGAEAKNRQRDLPFAILGSLVAVTALYLAVAFASVAAVPFETFSEMDVEAILSNIVDNALGMSKAGLIIDLGAVIAIFSVVLVALFALSRILYAISITGLLPRYLAGVNRRQAPQRATLIAGSVIAVIAALVPMETLAQTVSIGTIGAFILVNVSVLLVRRRFPHLDGFSLPGWPWIPIVAIVFLLAILSGMALKTWVVFGLWLLIGAAIYVFYGRSRSHLRDRADVDK
ncbi:MAG: amino acid permease [Candidatus Nanopelagicales bacterium]